MKKQIGKGAEAIIYLDKNIIKDRIKKSYRIKEIDEKLRRFRTKREAKVLEKLNALNFPAPKLIYCDKKEIIEMEYIKGPKLRDVIEKKDCIKLSKELGTKIAILHNNHIIHGDLTTSNMILNNELYLIDFGLSFFSHKTEDKAVDLHLLRQAMESKHYKIWKKCFDTAMKYYEKESDNGKEIIARIEQVESRGRYKGKQNRVNKNKIKNS